MPAIRLASFDSSIFQQPVEAQVRTLADMLMRYRRELEYLLNGQLDEDNGLVSADVVITNTLVTNTLYAEYGRIANLTVSELNTAWKKITNYLAADTSPVGYLHMYEQYAKWIIASTDGSATVQETDYDENPLYWIDETHTGMTTTVNAFPVLTYVYTEYVKREISFINIDGNDIPVELIGTGTGTGNNGKGFIYKDAANDLHVGIYHATTGVPIELLLSDDGPRKSGGTGDVQVRNVAITDDALEDIDGIEDGDQVIRPSDHSRYDRGTAATTCSIDPRLTELYEFTGSSAFTATITNTGLTAGCILKLINSSTVTVTLSATINGSTIYRMHPLDGLDLIWNGTDWRVVSASSLVGSAKMNSDGGYMVRMTNRTGGASVKGEVVCASSSYDSAVAKIAQNVPDPIGCFYESGIADGAEAWVVVSGRAQVYFIGNTTHGHLARGFVTSDSGYVTGQALSEAVPSSPFATDKHFYEIGHVIESRTGAGLAWTMLHFN